MGEKAESAPLTLPLRYTELSDLVGGRGWEEFRKTLHADGEHDRARLLGERCSTPPTLLFADDTEGRQALEILLVKVALFAELCRSVRERAAGGRPPVEWDPREIWVELPAAAPVIPGFWGFSLRPPAPGPLHDGENGAAGSPGPELTWLGRILQRSLFVNLRQSLQAVTEHRGSPEGGQDPFRPENLFYDPDGKFAHAVPLPLWRRIVLLAVRLGATGGEGVLETALERIVREIEAVQGELRRSLFFDPPGADRDIASVVSDLIGDPEWLAAVGQGQGPAEPTAERGSGRVPPPAFKPAAAEAPVPEPGEPLLEETIILGAGSGAPVPPAASPTVPHPVTEPSDAEEDRPAGLDETIILRPDPRKKRR